MLRIKLKLEVVGPSRVVLWNSDIIEGEDAKETQEMINNLSELKMFSFPCEGKMVFFNRGVLDQVVITVEELDETSD